MTPLPPENVGVGRDEPLAPTKESRREGAPFTPQVFSTNRGPESTVLAASAKYLKTQLTNGLIANSVPKSTFS
jgi:hypothetical protein